MSIIDTLVTDRTQADVDALKAALDRIKKGVGSEADWEAVNDLHNKGAYNYTDLNRVLEAVSYLHERLKSLGYRPDIQTVGGQGGGASGDNGGLPSGYTKLEYIQSSGTQRIDSGFIPNQKSSMKLKFSTTQASSGGVAVCDAAWQSDGFGVWCNAVGFADSTATNPPAFGDGIEHEVEITSEGIAYDNGAQIWAGTKSDFTAPCDLTLFCLNRNGSKSEYLTGKIYYCQLWDNGTLVRDFVPCLNDSGEVGLYDLVTASFYGNAGTGVFTAGPAVETENRTFATAWEEGNWMYLLKATIYLENIQNLRNVFSLSDTVPEAPETMDAMTIEQANNIEMILVDIYKLILNMESAWIYSADVFSGEV